MLASPARSQMSKLAREEALKHSWRGATDKLVEFYQQAVGLHGVNNLAGGL